MITGGARVLVVDDEPAIRLALRANLGRRGYQVATAASGEEALAAYWQSRPELIVLDLALPGIDGLEVIRRVRAEGGTPILVLSAREGEPDKIAALDLGADDYVTKPFAIGELLARVRVALRHGAGRSGPESAVVRAGPLVVDLERRLVTLDGREVHLTPIEWGVLRVLAEQPGRVFTQRTLLHRVWGPEHAAEGHYLHVHVANLRRKVEPDPAAPRHLVTEPGVGYRLRADA